MSGTAAWPVALAVSTRDPLDGVTGTPTTTNPYHYADNDPLNKTDPTGMRPQDPEYWGDARPSTMHVKFPVNEKFAGLHMIEVAGFIPQSETSLTPMHGPGPRMFKGDDRQFTEAGGLIDPAKNRFYATLNFATGDATFRVNPTCRATKDGWFVGGGCESGLPIVLGQYDGNNVFDPKYMKNYFDIGYVGDTFQFKWSVTHSDRGTGQEAGRARADGNLYFKPVGNGMWEPSWKGDCFPSLEVMQNIGGKTAVVGRVSDAGAEAMIGGVTSIYNLIGSC